MGTTIPNSQGTFPRGPTYAVTTTVRVSRPPIMNIRFVLLTDKQDRGAILFLANNSLSLKAHRIKIILFYIIFDSVYSEIRGSHDD